MKKNEMGGACSTYGKRERCIQGFGGETRGKRRFGKSRCRWKGNIKLIFKKWTGDMDRIDLAKCKDRWGGSCECGNES
jgi:hypothetical protein